MRAFDTSAWKSARFSQVWVTPGAVGLVVRNAPMLPAPNSASSTPWAAPELMQWAHGYSGCIGVSMRGSHAASRTVAGLSSWSAFRMAVMGRQNEYLYLASNTAM